MDWLGGEYMIFIIPVGPLLRFLVALLYVSNLNIGFVVVEIVPFTLLNS